VTLAIAAGRAVLLAAVGLTTLSASGAARPLSFEQAFDDRNEPASLHFTVRYLVGEQAHQLEVWRQGQTKLRRVTDGILETYAFRSRANDPEFRMTVLDRQRRISTRIDRTNLYRVGNFTDWFDLAHGLKYPKQRYVVTRIAAPAGATAPVDRCDWYALEVDGASRSICWSRKYRLPLLIYAAADRPPLWQVTTVSTAPVGDEVYAIEDAGYVKNDANRDIADD
jgi:hypothetical protein